jgi:hypothetical protein
MALSNVDQMIVFHITQFQWSHNNKLLWNSMQKLRFDPAQHEKIIVQGVTKTLEFLRLKDHTFNKGGRNAHWIIHYVPELVDQPWWYYSWGDREPNKFYVLVTLQ